MSRDQEEIKVLCWDDLPYELQEKILFNCAIDGVEGSKTAMFLDRKFSDVCKSQAYFKQVTFESLPRFPYKIPNSSEQEFMLDCYFADNPEVFYRLLMVDVWDYGKYSQVQYLLGKLKSGGHRHAAYMSFALKLMAPTEDMRQDGFNEMLAAYNSPGGELKIATSRWKHCWQLHRIYRGFNSFRLDVPRYCLEHSVPTFGERHFIDCNRCKADFETRIYCRRKRYEDILFQGYVDIMENQEDHD